MAPPSSGPPAPREVCAASAFTPEKVPVDIHMLIDSSASMGEPAGNQRKWDRALLAIEASSATPSRLAWGWA